MRNMTVGVKLSETASLSARGQYERLSLEVGEYDAAGGVFGFSMALHVWLPINVAKPPSTPKKGA